MIEDIGLVCVLELIEEEAISKADSLVEDFDKDGPPAKVWRKIATRIRQCIDHIERDANE